MLRIGFARVALVVMVLFVLPAVLALVVEAELESLHTEAGTLHLISLVLAVTFASLMRLLGPVVFAGYLDEAVGTEWFEGEQIALSRVLATLPWVPLLIADVIVVFGTGIGLALFLIPGFVFYAFFGLVGPVIVQERRGVQDAFRRTMRISRTALLLVAMLVVVPETTAEIVHEAAHQVVHDSGIVVQALVEWAISAVIGGAVGLLEVALATELMARNPEPASAREQPRTGEAVPTT